MNPYNFSEKFNESRQKEFIDQIPFVFAGLGLAFIFLPLFAGKIEVLENLSGTTKSIFSVTGIVILIAGLFWRKIRKSLAENLISQVFTLAMTATGVAGTHAGITISQLDELEKSMGEKIDTSEKKLTDAIVEVSKRPVNVAAIIDQDSIEKLINAQKAHKVVVDVTALTEQISSINNGLSAINSALIDLETKTKNNEQAVTLVLETFEQKERMTEEASACLLYAIYNDQAVMIARMENNLRAVGQSLESLHSLEQETSQRDIIDILAVLLGIEEKENTGDETKRHRPGTSKKKFAHPGIEHCKNVNIVQGQLQANLTDTRQ